MHKEKKTNAARLLDNAGVDYELIPYDVNEDDLSATTVASELGENIQQVFKTIVLTGDRVKLFVCVVPAGKEINLKHAARVSGNKKCETLPLKQLLPTTGYIRGGCSPVGMKKLLPTYFDVSALQFPYIFVSAGQLGLQFKISPRALAEQVHGTFEELV